MTLVGFLYYIRVFQIFVLSINLESVSLTHSLTHTHTASLIPRPVLFLLSLYHPKTEHPRQYTNLLIPVRSSPMRFSVLSGLV